MNHNILALYWTDEVDLNEILAQLAELNAIPGVSLVPLVPSELAPPAEAAE